MSNDREDAQQPNIHAILKNLKRTDPNSRFVDLSSLGPVTVHSTGSSEKPAPPANSSDDASYVKHRLEMMDEQERASMEEFLNAHPGLTAEKYMEMTIAYGF